MERMSISSDGGYGSNRDTSNSVIGTISPSLGVGKSVEDTSGMFVSGDSNNSLGLSDKYILIFKQQWIRLLHCDFMDGLDFHLRKKGA